MNYDDAKKVADQVTAIGGFSNVEVDHHGFYGALTEEVKVDGKWHVRFRVVDYTEMVNLWRGRAAAGNRNLYSIRDLPRDQKHLKLLAKEAKGKATDRDRAALGRIASEKANG